MGVPAPVVVLGVGGLAVVGLLAWAYRSRIEGGVAVLSDDLLSEHFSLRELTVSASAERLGLLNVPPADVIADLRRGAREVLEPIRALNGGPIRVTSGYRAPEVQAALTAAIGASKTSDHPNGRAADIYDARGVNSAEVLAERIYDAVRGGADIPVDQVIVEWHTGHLHVGWGPRQRARAFASGGWLQTHDGRTYTSWAPTSAGRIA